MLRSAAATIVAVASLSATLDAQVRPADPDAVLDSIEHQWSLGHYPEALIRMDALLGSAGGAASLERMALLTGELFRTDSVAADGRDVQWSRDGRYAAYSSGTGPARKLHIVSMTGERRVTTIPGRNLVFSPAGTDAAYLGVAETPAIATLRARADSAMERRDTEAFRRVQGELARLEAATAAIRVRDLRTGREREIDAPGLSRRGIAWAADGRTLYLIGGPEAEAGRSNIYAVGSTPEPSMIVNAAGPRTSLHAAPGGRYLVYIEQRGLVIRDLTGPDERIFPARAYATAADGSAIVFVQRDSAQNTLTWLPLDAESAPVELLRTARPLDNPALSPDKSRVVFQMMPRENWELYVIGVDGRDERRITHEVQHDLFPRFLDTSRVLAVIGEARHRRAHVHDLSTGERTKVFHNNTVRTISAEYEWAASPDGTKLLIVAERDGNTISPERSVYLTDLTRRVTVEELRARVRANLAAEQDLRERGRATFEPIEARVREAVQAVSVSRIHGYASDLFAFGSKYITQPGNTRAIEFLAARLREFGYEPELQWFEPRPGIRTANVIARLPGTTDPDLVYVISSHFDSVEEGPGSDDNTSGTTALLEAARVLATRPQAATIEFAFFTGEEAGLLGSREFVRRAVAGGKRIVGALNNDMIGFANDHRIDNTIRYSNDGVRDLQHAAAFLFTSLVTYDARYYKNTDAHAYYERYGDIVGGIGSYPILGNPHYHQSHDVLETVNQHLVAAVSGTTVASIMAMASAPSRLAGLTVTRSGSGAVAEWRPAAEQGVTAYLVAYGPADEPTRHRRTVTGPRAELPGATQGMTVWVKAVGRDGMVGWDWARGVVE
ncbi:MAG TPA: M20/M25/M40 family metallo-hydrolase [Gemmatimonadales bacterium]|nr:M20/M25/M40 family metallo-hydrolase [Gemmatimonadales bacterium]